MTLSHEELTEKAQHIQLLVMDVDGVLTNGQITYTESGEEIKQFNVKDGHGIALWNHSGRQSAIITGRESAIVTRRATELKIHHVFQGIKSKQPVLTQLVADLNLTFAQVAYVGDDTPDIPALELVGLALCPADAVLDVKRVCHYTTQLPGGQGAVREIIDFLLHVQHVQHAEPSLMQ